MSQKPGWSPVSKHRPSKPLPLAEDGLPRPLRWRPVFQAWGLVSGVLVCLGGLVLLQQLGETTLEPVGAVTAVGVGLVLGVTFPSIGRLYGVLRVNAMLRKMRAELARDGTEASA